jgi:type IV secretion system protein VirD4
MRGLGKWLNGGGNAPAFATAAARQAGNGAEHPALSTIEGPDVVSGFPRGLPDGDKHRPLATARWPSEAETFATLGAWKPGLFLIGRDSLRRYVGHEDDRHILTVAGSRAGKGISLIVPALLTWPHSAICIDPKGELATITASRRGRGSEWSHPMEGDKNRVYVLDPFKRVTGPAASYRSAFNPLADLDPDTDEGLDMAGQIADSLVVQQEGAAAHWTMSARAFLLGLVLFIAKTEVPQSRNLVTLRHKLLQPADDFEIMLDDMHAEGGVIARGAASLRNKPKDERASVISTCDTQTAWLEGESMASVLRGSDFRLEDLKDARTTVYLCLPAMRLGTHGRWLRLMIGMALEALERTGPLKEDQHRVLFCLDEFAVLGHMQPIERAAGQIAGFGVKLWPVIQDLTQLQRDYQKAWETFMGNAGLLTFFGNTDLTTLEHISKRLGETEVISTVTNTTDTWQYTSGKSSPGLFDSLVGQGVTNSSEGANRGGNRTASETLQRAALLNPDEIARHFSREAGNILAFVPDKPPAGRPFALHRCRYFSPEDDGLFGGLFDPAPGQPLPRTSAAERQRRDGHGT